MSFSKNCRCIACDALRADAPFGARFENSFDSRRFCESCGQSDGFYDSVERWVSTASDWRPWTWMSGYWEKVSP